LYRADAPTHAREIDLDRHLSRGTGDLRRAYRGEDDRRVR